MDRQAHDYAAAMGFVQQQQQQQTTSIQQQQQFGFHQQFPPSVHGPPFLPPDPSLQQYPFPRHINSILILHHILTFFIFSSNNSLHLYFLHICPLILFLHLSLVHMILHHTLQLHHLILNSKSESINLLSTLWP
ncbi:hypothetical protein CsSME_00001363 [Camellia sinensis var. sinensis]